VTNTSSLLYGRYQFTLHFESAFVMPPTMTSLLRSVFGMMLRRQVCVFKQLECTACPLLSQCIYPEFFEAEARAATNRLALPYVLAYPLAQQTGDGSMIVEFALTLIEGSISRLPYIVNAFEQAGDAGIRWSSTSHRFQLTRVTDLKTQVELYQSGKWHGGDWQVKPSEITVPLFQSTEHPQAVGLSIKLKTPFRAKSDNRILRKVDIKTILNAAARRLQLFMGGAATDVLNPYRASIDNLSGITENRSDFTWKEIRRYSGRQRTTMALGGLVGNGQYVGNLLPYKPLLEAAKVVHIGKQAAFGFGEFDFEYSHIQGAVL
jgi:hypothetical protein